MFGGPVAALLPTRGYSACTSPRGGSKNRFGSTLVRIGEDIARNRGADHMTLDVDVDDARAILFYEALGYAIVQPHQHHWRSVDPRTGAVLNEGWVATLIMRRPLR